MTERKANTRNDKRVERNKDNLGNIKGQERDVHEWRRSDGSGGGGGRGRGGGTPRREAD